MRPFAQKIVGMITPLKPVQLKEREDQNCQLKTSELTVRDSPEDKSFAPPTRAAGSKCSKLDTLAITPVDWIL
jgi:hypothetical protein